TYGSRTGTFRSSTTITPIATSHLSAPSVQGLLDRLAEPVPHGQMITPNMMGGIFEAINLRNSRPSSPVRLPRSTR
ncbi:MAG: hypothetical protein J7452_05545, partial [Thermoflexus sp.]|nr:hypothetical protein [Thermoflexus sp.]